MAEALVKFFLQRLESLLLQESEIFAKLEDQIEKIKGAIRATGRFLEDAGSRTEGDADFVNWENQLKVLLHEMDDHVDDFIIQMDQKNESDRLALTNCFRSQLQKIDYGLAETLHRMTDLNSSDTDVGDKGERGDAEEQLQGKEEVQTEANASTIKAEKEENDGSNEQSHGKNDAQTSAESSSVPFRLKYMNLPYYLRSCLMYCCIFPENYWISKGKLIRLLVAEGLVQEKAGQILEDVAEENINELVSQGMLQVDEQGRNGTKFTVSSPYRLFLRENFVTAQANSNFTIPHTARRILTSDMKKIAHELNNLRPWSLFLLGDQDLSEGNWLNFTGAKFLRVLDLENARIKSLPEEVGALIHLTYLGLEKTYINELPASLGKLRVLQTLDISWCAISTALPPEVLNLVRLRHLKMSKNIVSGIKLPEGIGRFQNLLTLTGICAGDGFAEELGELSQLRRLEVLNVTEENANELDDSIMKMHALLCLSLEAIHDITPRHRRHLVLLDSFSPPQLLRKLRLEGQLEKIPNWLGSMECLTKLRLGFSHLSENPALVLQLLPNLKTLTLWHAYNGKQLGKEFCKAGGFPKLEVLSIASGVLEEWTELEKGALPSLQYLHFNNCSSLRMLPEGLQYVTTLKHLDLLPLLDDHAQRLKPDGGEENYKVKHIPKISFLPVSELTVMFKERFGTPSAPPPAAHEE